MAKTYIDTTQIEMWVNIKDRDRTNNKDGQWQKGTRRRERRTELSKSFRLLLNICMKRTVQNFKLMLYDGV